MLGQVAGSCLFKSCLSSPRTLQRAVVPSLQFSYYNEQGAPRTVLGSTFPTRRNQLYTFRQSPTASLPSALVLARQSSSLAARAVAIAPSGVQPYLKLARMDKPIGAWLLFWPCGWGLGMAAAPGTFPDPFLLATFASGALVMRGAGCTINDMWDRKIDQAVERTKDRPLASGQVSMFDALTFLSLQLGVGSLILLQLNWFSVLLGASSLGIVVLYPLMKRLTYYPQLVLGLAFNWGALLGWSATMGSCDWGICLALYTAGISWTMIYDTIYAHQDKYDDVIIGVKSTAIKFGAQTPICLSCFASTMGVSLLYSGWLNDQTWPFYTAVGAVLAHISHQIYTLDINDREDCAKKFVSNRWVGLILALGCIGGSFLKDEVKDAENEAKDVQAILSKAANINILAKS